MEEAKPRYYWVEDLVSSNVKAIGTYLATLYLLCPKSRLFDKNLYRYVDKRGDFIMTSQEVKTWLAFYFAGKAEYIREAYEAGKEFVDKLFAYEPSAFDSYERKIILGEIEFNFYNNFLKAFKKHLKLANIPEELRGIVREVLFDVRTQLYGGSLITHAGTTTIREDILRKNIEDYRKLKGEDTNKLILCMEKSGLILKYHEHVGAYSSVPAYIFPAVCLSDEVIALLVRSEKLSGSILERTVAEVFTDLGFSDVIPNYRSKSKAGSPVEVDVWAWKQVDDNTNFTVYVSCKNWDKPIGREVIDEETGRVMNLDKLPNLKIIIASGVNQDAKKLAEANGFLVIERGKKATEENRKEIYELVYRVLNKIFSL
jgi:hypothetical protein